MELKQIRKLFYEDVTYSKKNFVISINEKEDVIYYKGIKILIIKDNKLRISSNLYEMNEEFIKLHREDLSKEYSRNKIFKNLAKIRMMLFSNGLLKSRKKMLFRYDMSLTKSNINKKTELLNNRKVILNNVKQDLKDLVKFVKLNDTCVNKNGNNMDCCSISCDLKINDKTDIEKMFNLVNIEYVLLNNFINSSVSGWKVPTILVNDVCSYSIDKLTTDKLNEIINTMKLLVDEYLNVNFDAEKYYIHQFMTDKKVLKQFKQLDADKLYRYESEYYTFNSQNKGKVDSIFVSMDGNDLYLIELKVNRSMIKGENGIHKQLIDMEDLCNPKLDNLSSFIRKIRQNVDYYRMSLEQEKIEFAKKMKIHFWTIIAYNEKKEKEYIKRELLDKFNTVNGLSCVKKVVESKNGYSNRVKTLKEHFTNLAQYNCDAKIYFDLIEYDKKDKKIILKGNKLEEYRIK